MSINVRCTSMPRKRDGKAQYDGVEIKKTDNLAPLSKVFCTFALRKQRPGLSLASLRCERKVRAA